MGQLPNNVNDIFSINGLTNIINKPTHFDSRTGNSSLLDPILITDNVPLIDSDTIHIERKISDHEGTCVTIRCGYSNLKSYQRSLGLQAGGFPINETKNNCQELRNTYTK